MWAHLRGIYDRDIDGPRDLPLKKAHSRPATWLKCSIVFLFIVVTLFTCLVPIFALVNIAGQLGEVLGTAMVVFFWLAYSIWLILNSDWSQLAGLLLVFLGWLLSVGLL